MLPQKCLTSCAVPYLCLIACPLNRRLEQLTSSIDRADDALPASDESLSVEIVGEEKPRPPQPSD
jgi:hypothetical protein